MPFQGVSAFSVASTIRLSNLVNGQSYSIALRASNADVLGSPSVSHLAIPSTVPDVARNLSVQAFDSGVTVSWNAPASDGGLAISGYEYSLDNGVMWNDVAENPMTIRGLINGTTYRVKVRAKNDNGTGAATAAMLAIPSTVPRATGIPVATAGTNSAVLNWTAPTDNGGSAITDYIIEYSTNNGTTWATVTDGTNTSTSVTISNLTAGTSYVFRVTPVSAVGTGEPSVSSNAVTPQAPVVETPADPAAPDAPSTPSTPSVPSKGKPTATPNTDSSQTTDGSGTDSGDSISKGNSDDTTNTDTVSSPTDDNSGVSTGLIAFIALASIIGVLGIVGLLGATGVIGASGLNGWLARLLRFFRRS
jgi:hypothetical protein